MIKCPLCGRKMYRTKFQSQNEMLCPVHSSFTKEEEGASAEYYQFRYDLHRIDALVGVTGLFKKNETKNIKFLTRKGYSNPKELIQERIWGYLDWIRIADIATLKIAVTRYAANKGYKDVGKMCSENKDIVKRHSIQFRRGSIFIPSLELLKSIRDYIEHPNLRKPDDNMKELMANVPNVEDPLSFLYESVEIIKSGNKKSVLFIRGISEEERHTLTLNSMKDMESHSHRSYETFLDYLREEIREVIFDIDKDGK